MTASDEGLRSSSHHGRNDAGLRTRSLSVATRNFLSLSAPRLIDGRPRQAGFLARGLESLHHLPGSGSSGFRCKAHRLQLRGQPGLVHPSSLKSPYRGTCRVRVRCRKTVSRSTKKGRALADCVSLHNAFQASRFSIYPRLRAFGRRIGVNDLQRRSTRLRVERLIGYKQ